MDMEDLAFGPQVWRGKAGHSSHAVLATGFDALDRKLSGGWPWGAVTEIFVERHGSGELSLLMPALASLSADAESNGGWIVWVAPPWVPYAPALTRCGIKLERILLVDPAAHPDVQKSFARKGAAALWAVEQALRSAATVVVLAWLESATDTQLRRLQLAAEERHCGLMLFRPATALRHRSPAALRVKLSASAGGGTRVDILKCRGARPAQLSLDLPRGGRCASIRSGEAGCR